MFLKRLLIGLPIVAMTPACDRLEMFTPAPATPEVELLSEVELDQEVDPVRLLVNDLLEEALADDPKPSLWDRLRGKDQTPDVPVADADPAQVDLPLDTPEVAAVDVPDAQDTRRGIWRYLPKGLVPPTPDPAPTADAAAIEAVLADVVATQDVAAPEGAVDPADTTPMLAGLFGFLRPSPSPDPSPNPSDEGAPNAEPDSILALFSKPDDAPDAGDVAPMADLAFGALERTCGLGRRDMGREVTAASGFRIYDTDPGSTVSRPHYITGFDDGCARQFSAALVLLGDVGTHEVVRYSSTRVRLDYSNTDDAYEAIKTRFCRVDEGAPCGSRLERLGKVTTFVTAYKSFGAAPEWAEFLLHDGEVAAVDIEGL